MFNVAGKRSKEASREWLHNVCSEHAVLGGYGHCRPCCCTVLAGVAAPCCCAATAVIRRGAGAVREMEKTVAPKMPRTVCGTENEGVGT